MRETIKMENFNCKTQAHTRVCEEYKLEKIIPYETILRLKLQV